MTRKKEWSDLEDLELCGIGLNTAVGQAAQALQDYGFAKRLELRQPPCRFPTARPTAPDIRSMPTPAD